MRKNFKHGKWVKATGIPHADISKFVDKKTGKEIDDKPGSRSRKSGSTMEFKKPKKSRGPSAGRQAQKEIKVSKTQTGLSKGILKFQHGGRTNLFEELGRVEGERSNRNRRAEVSRIHGELNKGYSLGGSVGAAKRGFNKKILRNS